MPETLSSHPPTGAALVLIKELQEQNLRLFLALKNLAGACRFIVMPPLAEATVREAEDLISQFESGAH